MSKFINHIDEERWIEEFTNWNIINYYENIYESFNSSAKIKIDTKFSWMFTTSFTIFNIKYIFTGRILDDNKTVIILFHPLDNEIDIFKERKNNSAYLGILFGSIIQSIKLMLKEHFYLNKIVFTAENKKLERIYDILNRTIQKRFPDWNLEKTEINKDGKKNYIYVRNNND